MNQSMPRRVAARDFSRAGDVANDPLARADVAHAPPQEFFSELRAEARRATDAFFEVVGLPEARIHQKSRH